VRAVGRKNVITIELKKRLNVTMGNNGTKCDDG
jgi:hypothetical protein